MNCWYHLVGCLERVGRWGFTPMDGWWPAQPTVSLTLNAIFIIQPSRHELVLSRERAIRQRSTSVD